MYSPIHERPSASVPRLITPEPKMSNYGIKFAKNEDVLRISLEDTRKCWNILLFKSGIYSADMGYMESGLYITPVLCLSESVEDGGSFKGYLLSIPFASWQLFDTYGLERKFGSCTFNPYVAISPMDYSFLEKLFDILENIVDSADTHIRDLELKYVCRALVSTIQRFYTTEKVPVFSLSVDSITDRFLRLVGENCLREKKLEFYAKELKVSPKYLSHVISKTTGQKANSLIAESVISSAKTILASTSYPIQSVSQQVGFASCSDFCRYFRSHTGISPSAYRKASKARTT